MKHSDAIKQPIRKLRIYPSFVCKKCLKLIGHHVQYCSECGGETARFDKKAHGGMSIRDWILAAPTERVRIERCKRVSREYMDDWRDDKIMKAVRESTNE